MALVPKVVGAARRVPLAVWWITALYLLVLLAYSILFPTFRAPDEPQHVDLARYVSEELSYPAWDERNLSPGVARTFDDVRFSERSAHLTAAQAVPKNERPSFDDLEDPPGRTGLNQMPQHPPLYYVVAGLSERAAEAVIGDPSYDLETWIYRVVSILCVAPLPLIIWHIASRLGVPRPVGIAATLVPLTIPQLTHIGSAVNNDNLLMLLVWMLAPVVLRIGTGDIARRTMVLAGVLSGLALLTKGFALVVPLWIMAGLLVVLGREGKDRLRPIVSAGAIYAAVTMAVGGWWWVRNLVLYQQLAPSRYDEYIPPADNVDVQIGSFVRLWAYRTNRRFWGEFGWFDVALPTLAFGVATVLVVVAVVAAFVRRDRVAGTAIGDRVLLLVPIGLFVGQQFALALRAYLSTGHLPGMQGRYWFGALAPLAVLVALGLANLVPRFVRILPSATLIGVMAIQAIALQTILNFYWDVPGRSLASRLRAVVAWAPLPGELIAVGAALALVVGAGTLFQAAQVALDRPGAPSDRGLPPSTNGPAGDEAKPQPDPPTRVAEPVVQP